ncbi:tyrosine-type recombinase/integrase [Pseudoalteromonas luteoviolacea]|uniref:Tyr recombinase domain-containing protein n=1 Tax=Pseudoalteromonas luteoviolacea NCIMB 1942 TaxID=1365253 RepID=A0A167GKV7_9GAMM|nr:tyrosine-type recombinase/integrase [Pseudoalteromonas luteoviolacea]KZN55774.1 hypothetical protein N482_04690 [Pseudoalteromonas luteoviolacea NCIMB 1942]
MPKSNNSNHPKRGSSIKVQPIRTRQAINTIKAHLKHQPRNLCLFTLGINKAYRANELLSLTIGQVIHLQVGDYLELKQSKNKQYRPITLNTSAITAIQNWLDHHPNRLDPSAPLFVSFRRLRKPLTVPALNRLVKSWCKHAKLNGNFGSHTLRKTWGYHQRIENHASVALLMRAFRHATEAQTLDYLGIIPDEIKDMYLTLEL